VARGAVVRLAVVFALFRHVTLAVYSPLPGPGCSLLSGPVSPSVHTNEDQRDRKNNDAHKHGTADAEAMSRPWLPHAEEEEHYPSPTE
jgi:hypothetical protein